jgi:hypothetical protein
VRAIGIYAFLPWYRWPRRILWLTVRKSLVPWCIRPGCWARSVESPTTGRGNICARHLLAIIMGASTDTEDTDG